MNSYTGKAGVDFSVPDLEERCILFILRSLPDGSASPETVAGRTPLCLPAQPWYSSAHRNAPHRGKDLILPQGILAKAYGCVEALGFGCGRLEFDLIPVPSVCLHKGIRLKGVDVLQDSWIQVADYDPSTSCTCPRGILQLFSPVDMIAALQYK